MSYEKGMNSIKVKWIDEKKLLDNSFYSCSSG